MHESVSVTLMHLLEELESGIFCQAWVFADLHYFLTHKYMVGEGAWHVNKHVRIRVLKLETDLCSVWDQLFKGHTEQVSNAQ